MPSTHTPESAVQPFAVVRKGFDREQVAATLARLEAEAELLRADRDAAVERAERATAELERHRDKVVELESRIAELGRAPVTNEQMSDRLSTMLALATAEAASMRDNAHSDADRILNEAEEAAWRMRESAAAELSAVRTRNDAVRAEHDAALDAARTRAAEIVRSAESEAKRLDDVAARRRDQIDEDHRLASNLRREESLDEDRARRAATRSAVQALRSEARDRADEIVRDAEQHANDIMDRARKHTELLRALREDVLAELASVRARLEPLPTGVANEEPLPETPRFNSSDG